MEGVVGYCGVGAERVARRHGQSAARQAWRLKIKCDARGLRKIAPLAVIRSVGESVAGQRGRVVSKLLRIFRRPARYAIRTQIWRPIQRIGIGRVAIDFTEYLLGQDQRSRADQRAEVP